MAALVAKEPDTTTTTVSSPSPTTQDAPRRSFRSFIWDTDTHLKSLEEKHLLLKLDIAILTTGCLGFFMKYGKPLQRLRLRHARSPFYIPSTLIIQRVRPSIWLAAMEIGWGIFTFAQAGLHNVNELYAFRFLVGFFESSFFPSLLYLLGSWYTRTELAKRVALFHMTAPLGTAFGGYLQAAVYKNLNGQRGLEGWRWLYIVCGCMTIPVGIATLFVLPDTPYTTRAWFISEKEREIAIERVQRAGKAPPVKITLNTFKRILSSWKWYAFVAGYVLYGSACGGNGYFGIWLKSENFSVAQRNVIPTGTSLISAACVVLWGFLSDYTGSRFAFVLIPLIYGLLPNGILAFWPPSLELKQFVFLTIGVQLMTAVFYSWANEICADDNEQQAVVISSMNGVPVRGCCVVADRYLPQTMAPTFRGIWPPTTFGLVIAAIIGVVVIQLLILRDERRAKRVDNGGGIERLQVLYSALGQIMGYNAKFLRI
ncbi:hypothetical protein BDV12DRAFT_190839 [Aspergillus spectabilis]